MSLQHYLIQQFTSWKPPAPEVLNRSKGDITLCWDKLEPFQFLTKYFLYRVEKNNKIPKWTVVYSGGKSTKTIENLAPRHPHKFRIKVIIKTETVPSLAEKALEHFVNEQAIYEHCHKHIENGINTYQEGFDMRNNIDSANDEDMKNGKVEIAKAGSSNANGDTVREEESMNNMKMKWLESQWSEETWTNTDTDGTSAVCFAMAVRCGYLKQVQNMLEERPGLINIVNSNNGYTPLATAVRQGDINTIRLLLLSGADLEQPSAAGLTPLHLAVLAGNVELTELLIDRGADFHARDWNGMRIEHYAVDSCDLGMIRYVFDKGGDVSVEDNNGWTPLFRACYMSRSQIKRHRRTGGARQ
uniref:Uncharacterized protein n=1 Tax=Bombyx mori TaxID=7091 RepID=A0A8R2M895_BOMMO|nr:putative ankyrin repeat protein RF_0381 isoform X2 [Bombyx mori]